MEVIKGGAYELPKQNTEQIKIILEDIEGKLVEAIFNKPTTLQILEKQDESVEAIPCPDQEEKYIFKYTKSKELRWIFENLLVVPAELTPECISVKSLKEILLLFPRN